MERRAISRRVLLADLGKVTVALSVFGVAACSGDGSATTTLPANTTPATSSSAAPTEAPQPSVAPTQPAPTTSEAIPEQPLTWERVVLGFVSAYTVVRAGEATVVDTGNGGGEDAIGQSLQSLGVDWDSVAHVVLTHRHGDHIGGLEAVLDAAPSAIAYAGAADIASITAPRPLVAVGDGDRVMGLEVIATPGHTQGHISLLDATASLLIAGDALFGAGAGFEVDAGGVGPSPPQFTSDQDQAAASIVKLAGFSFDTVVFGHGSPIQSGASAAVAQLASG